MEYDALPSPPASRSMTLPILTLTTPRKPWSFFLNFFWSNICTASTLSSVTLLLQIVSPYRIYGKHSTHRSKLSFQYGLSVFFMTLVVLVCSPLMVATANGSGNPGDCIISFPWFNCGEYVMALTEDMSLVEPVGSDD